MQLTEHFTSEELACRCCGACDVRPALLKALEALREKAGPLLVNSGYRCQSHNKAVRGAKQSAHCQGLGADVRSASLSARQLAKLALETPGIRGVGLDVEQGYVHVDAAERTSKWMYRNGRVVAWDERAA